MKKILENSLDFSRLGDWTSEDLKVETKKAVISRDGKKLTLELELNFVLPVEDLDRFKRTLVGQLQGVEQVQLKIEYRDLKQSVQEAMQFYIAHMIMLVNGKYAHVTKTIYTDRWDLTENQLKIYALGELSVEVLNKEVASKFEELLARDLGIQVSVVFINNSDTYKVVGRQMEEKERDVFEEHRKRMEQMQQQNQERAASAEDGGFSGGFAGGAPAAPAPSGGFGGGENKSGGQKFRRRRNVYKPVKGNLIMGDKISGNPVAISEITSESGVVVIEGEMFKKDSRTTRSDSKLVTLYVTDKVTSISVKAFTMNEKWEDIDSHIKEGDWVKIKGQAQWDRFDNTTVVMADSIEKAQKKVRKDTCQKKRVELHAHTKMSAMDGLNEVSDLVKTAARWGQPAVAITDHGVVQSFPDAAKTAKKLASDKNNPIDIKIIYGMEGYVFDDSDCYKEDGSIDFKKKGTNHIILLARTQEGLKNIYKLVSYSHLDYFYKRPRLPKSLIAAHREGLIIGSACEAGEVYRAIYTGNKSQEEIEEIASFYDYLEIQPLINNQFMIDKGLVSDKEQLKEYNRQIIELAKKQNKLVVATTDAHYAEPGDAIYRNILMAGMGFKDAENGQGLYMRTTDEMLEEFSYLGEDTAYQVVVENTNKIADMIDDGILPVPKGKFPPKIENADVTLRETCMERAYSIYGNPLPEEIASRLETELNSIIGNGYAVMYVSAQKLVKKSNEDGYLVGSRGSVGSSFAATMAGITEVNPLDPHYICPNCKHLEWGDMHLYDCGIDMPEKECPECGTMMNRDGYTIPFATFLGFNGDKEPDIDLNFAGEYQATAHKYVGTIFGEENVYKAGTVGTVADKTAYGYVMKFADQFNRPINKIEADRLTQGCTGVKRTTGQHPGGIIIVPDDHEIYEFCPVQHPANDVKSDIITTHFDYHKIDENLLKLDILGHNIPSMIRQLQDMTGIDPMKADLTDRTVLSIFNGTEALNIQDPEYQFTHGSYAIPEFGTSFVRQMLDDTKPDKFADLVRISGFSHGTDVWLNNAQDYIRDGTATMREVISTRDDIMNYLILKGIENKTSFQIMEDVRKNRPLKEEQLEVMKEHDVPDWYIDSCIKIQYMFPRAHAVAYVMMSFRMAWYKVYYPVEFYATYFTSVVANFDADVILRGSKACLDRIGEIKAMGNNATAKDQGDILVLEVAYEMYARGYEFAPARLGKSRPLKFWNDDGKVLLPFVAIPGMGEGAAKSFAEAYEQRPYETVEEVMDRGKVNKSVVEELRRHGVLEGLPETAQMSLF